MVWSSDPAICLAVFPVPLGCATSIYLTVSINTEEEVHRVLYLIGLVYFGSVKHALSVCVYRPLRSNR